MTTTSKQEQAKRENDLASWRGAKAITYHIEQGFRVSPFDAAKSAITDVLHAYCSGENEDLDALLAAAKLDYLSEFKAEFPEEVAVASTEG